MKAILHSILIFVAIISITACEKNITSIESRQSAYQITYVPNTLQSDKLYLFDTNSKESKILVDSVVYSCSGTWSPDGKYILYKQVDSQNGNTTCSIMGPVGKDKKKLITLSGVFFNGEWSPSNTQILLSKKNSLSLTQIYALDVLNSTITQLSDDRGSNFSARWSPDGDRILFNSDRNGSLEVFVMNSDGTNINQLIAKRLGYEHSSAEWSNDGSKIVYVERNPSIAFQDSANFISIVDLEKGTTKILTTHWSLASPKWAPDDSQLLFAKRVATANTVAVEELFTIDVDGSNEKQVTNSGTRHLSFDWLPDGSGIVYKEIETLYLSDVNGNNRERLFSVENLFRWSVSPVKL